MKDKTTKSLQKEKIDEALRVGLFLHVQRIFNGNGLGDVVS